MLASFDVFDTLITRPYATPEDLYLHLGEVLEDQGLVQNARVFADKRWDAEGQARRDRGGERGVGISEIYALLALQFGWDKEQMASAMDLEVHLEYEAVRPVPDGVRLVEEARKRGHTVCFISDMHLHTSHIRNMLSTAGVLQNEHLFVSSDAEAVKGTGELFRKALITLETDPGKTSHIGDNARADYRGAKRSGIRATLYTRTHLNRFERASLEIIDPDNWQLRTLAGVSKMTRLLGPDDTLHELLASTIAPFVTGFALWLIRQAGAMGIKTLYFLARDMQIVHEVTSFLADRSGADLKCSYIYASRQSWQPAGYSEPDDFNLFWLTDQLSELKPHDVLSRLLRKDDLEELAALHKDWNNDRVPWSRDQIRRLLETEPVCAMSERAGQDKRALLLSYLADSGYDFQQPFALVDAGWRGTLQKSLTRAFRLQGIESQTVGFYIGLRHLASAESNSALFAFLPDEVVKRLGFSMGSVVEALLTANHGSTIGYAVEEGRTKPVLYPDPEKSALNQWEAVRKICLLYAGEYCASPVWEQPIESVLEPLITPFLLFCEYPLPEEARLFTSWTFDTGQKQAYRGKLVSRLGWKDIGRLVKARLKSQPLANVYLSSPWLHGAISASPAPQRTLAMLMARR